LFPRVDDKTFDELAEVPVLGLDVDGEERFEALADDAFEETVSRNTVVGNVFAGGFFFIVQTLI
jgi:hypothetical protein